MTFNYMIMSCSICSTRVVVDILCLFIYIDCIVCVFNVFVIAETAFGRFRVSCAFSNRKFSFRHVRSEANST